MTGAAKEHEPRTTYHVRIDGCDATTCFQMGLTRTEAGVLVGAERKSREVAGNNGCMPRIKIEVIPHKCYSCTPWVPEDEDEA